MDHYADIDVSLECSSVCVVDTSGKIVREGNVATEPGVLVGTPVFSLTGGTKKRQQRDIGDARAFWRDYRDRKRGRR
jgi:hypothetical protein